MIVAIIGTNGLPAAYGGFETLTNHLVTHTKNVMFHVYCPKTASEKRLITFNGAKLIYLPFKANGFQSILYDIVSICHAWFTADTLVILGTPGCIILPLRLLFPSKKILVNFGGLEWKRKKWGKLGSIYLKLTEAISMQFADHIVADNMAFVDYIKETYNKDSILIEYGGDHVKQSLVKQNIERYTFLKHTYFVSVSRAQEDNNLHLLLEAFSKTPTKHLVLVSNWKVSSYGMSLLHKYQDFPNLFLIGPIYNQEEIDIIRGGATAYIHSHSFCGSAPSLIEAMYLGLPIISFKTSTNLYTTENQAFYFETSDDILSLLSEENTELMVSNGNKMKEIANRRYKWEIISKKYKDLY